MKTHHKETIHRESNGQSREQTQNKRNTEASSVSSSTGKTHAQTTEPFDGRGATKCDLACVRGGCRGRGNNTVDKGGDNNAREGQESNKSYRYRELRTLKTVVILFNDRKRCPHFQRAMFRE